MTQYLSNSGTRRMCVRLRTSSLRVAAAFAGVMNALVAAAEPVTDPREYATQARLAPRSLLLDGTRVNGRLIAVGERGHILLSQDGGSSWVQAEVPSRATLTGVYFHDGKLGWAVGHDAVILRTRDGGEGWERVYHAPEEERPLLDVWFKDAARGYAIGAYGYFLESRDGGKTWLSRTISDDDFHLNHIAEAPNGRLYIAAEGGVVYRSDDWGDTWKELPSPYKGSYFGTQPLEGESLLLFGLRGRLFRSDNAGQHWQPIQVTTRAMLTAALRLQPDRILITGLAGIVLVSDDNGQSFSVRQQPDRLGITGVLPAQDDSVVLLGEFGARPVPLSQLR